MTSSSNSHCLCRPCLLINIICTLLLINGWKIIFIWLRLLLLCLFVFSLRVQSSINHCVMVISIKQCLHRRPLQHHWIVPHLILIRVFPISISIFRIKVIFIQLNSRYLLKILVEWMVPPFLFWTTNPSQNLGTIYDFSHRECHSTLICWLVSSRSTYW